MHLGRVSRGSSRKMTPCAPQRKASITRSRSREANSITARVLAFNFLDGADGLAAGITGVIALGYVTIAGYALSVYGHAVAWSLLGACVGFLIFNFPPAKIFMGDSGSTVLGFSVAFLGLDFIAAHSDGGAGRASLFALLIAGLPLLDALVVVLRRVMKGKSPFHG